MSSFYYLYIFVCYYLYHSLFYYLAGSQLSQATEWESKGSPKGVQRASRGIQRALKGSQGEAKENPKGVYGNLVGVQMESKWNPNGFPLDSLRVVTPENLKVAPLSETLPHAPENIAFLLPSLVAEQ